MMDEKIKLQSLNVAKMIGAVLPDRGCSVLLLCLEANCGADEHTGRFHQQQDGVSCSSGDDATLQ